MYQSNSDNPFLNTLFVLEDGIDIMKRYNYHNFHQISLESLSCMYLFNEKKIKRKQLIDGIEIIHRLNEIKNLKNVISRESQANVVNKTNLTFNEFKLLFLDLRKHKLISVDKEVMLLNLFDCHTAFSTFFYPIDPQNYNITKYSSASHNLTSFYFVLKFMRSLEKLMNRECLIRKPILIDEKKYGSNIDDYFLEIEIMPNRNISYFEDEINELERIANVDLIDKIDEIKGEEIPDWARLTKENLEDLQKSLRLYFLEPLKKIRTYQASSDIKNKEIQKEKRKKIEKIERVLSKEKAKKEENKVKKIMNLKIYSHSQEDKEVLAKKPKNKIEERRRLGLIFILDNERLKSSEIATLINKEIYDKTGKYPLPLYSECEMRAIRAWILIRAKKDMKYPIISTDNYNADENLKKYLIESFGKKCQCCGDSREVYLRLINAKNINIADIYYCDLNKEILLLCGYCLKIYDKRSNFGNLELPLDNLKQIIWTKNKINVSI